MQSNEEKTIKKFRLDIIVISAILAVALVSLALTLSLRREGAFVEVEIDGRTVCEYPLDENGRYVLNGGTNTLVIENGSASIRDSSCPDHTCERRPKSIKYVGQTIVCLPNRITVTVRGESDNAVDLTS